MKPPHKSNWIKHFKIANELGISYSNIVLCKAFDAAIRLGLLFETYLISVINWETVLNEDHPSEAFEKFNQIVSNIYDSTCLLKETNPRKNKPRKPWCDDELLNLFNMRNQACEEHLNHPQNNELHVMYKELRNRADAL
jgi:hypothetical protein